ncbi:similar to An07g06370 [Aspergillus luchuensis]|uniref:Similar to An07g06370 n=1 Tax=Aspergillus kawachii TaxID=1069201 RepID=A0A146F169_ASPKA|nr:similar to An07g06370 [Aspergillus luchuensis]
MQVLMQLSRQAQSGLSRFPAPRTAAMDLDLVLIVRFPGVTTTAGRLPWKILPVTQRLPSIHTQRALSSNRQAWSAIDLIEVWVFFTYNGMATPLAI